MNNFNPYYILGINQGCSQNDIKRAYRHLAKKYHPDRSTRNSDQFIKIQTAYEMLMGTQSLKEQTVLSHNELKKSFQQYNKTSPISETINKFNNVNISPDTIQQQNQSNNTLKDNLEHLQTKIFNHNQQNTPNIDNTKKINFETIDDIPINKNEFGKVVQEYMKKRNIKSITNIFDNSFDLSIFNQIYVDLKQKSSTEIIVKDPVAYNSNSNSLITFSLLNNDQSIKEDYKNVFKNNANNPNDVTIKNKYKQNNEFIRDDILDDNYYHNIKKKINAYKNNSFS